MDYDALIEQLAFGKTTPKLSSCLGMYLSPDVIYLCETHMDKGRPVVDNLVRVAVPAPAAKAAGATATATTLNTDFLNENEKLAGLIRTAMDQGKWTSKDVIVTLSHHIGLLRYFTMPGMDRRFWGSAVPMEAKKYIPIPFDALSYDFQVIGLAAAADAKPRQGALVAVSPKKNLPNVAALLQALDLRLLGMEVAPCSVLRMWNSLDGGAPPSPFCQVHFDGGNVRIMVSDQGLPVFFREVFMGAETTAADSRKIDIGGCASFAQKQLGVGKLARVRVSGAGVDLGQWKDTFTQELGMPAEPFDVAGQLKIKGGDWGGFAAIGGSLRYQAPTPLTIDLSETGRISDGEKRAARDIFLISVFLGALILANGIFQMAQLKLKKGELKKFRRDAELEAVFAGKSPEDIELMLKNMSTQADTLGPLDPGSRVKMASLLKEVVAALPEKVWLTNISITVPLKNPVIATKEMRLTGHAAGASLGEERDLAFKFRDQLTASPIIGKIFKDIQVSVTGKALGEEAAKTLEQDALKKQLEQRTSFTVTATSKKK